MHFDSRTGSRGETITGVTVRRPILRILLVAALLFPRASSPAESVPSILPPAELDWSDTVFQAIQKLRSNQGISELSLASNGSTVSVLDVETSRQLVDKMYAKNCFSSAMEIDGFKGKEVREQDIRLMGGIVPVGGVPFKVEVQFDYNEGVLLTSPG